MAETKEKVRLSAKEIVWLSISLVVVTAGLVFFVLHFVGDAINNAGIENKYNLLYQAQDAMVSATKMGWLYWGLIIFAAGVIALLITLNYFASHNEKTADSQRKRGKRVLTEDDVRQAVEVKEASAE